MKRSERHTTTQLIAKPGKSLSNRTATAARSQAKLCETVYDGKLRTMTNDHVILNVHIDAGAGQEEKLAEQLRALVAPTRSEAGCLTYELHRDPQNPRKFMFYERFTSQTALDEHLASPYFKNFVAYRAAGNLDPVASISITTWRSIA
jgi:quinol monooxygenase YgiN